jgi:predicted small metal-binding protein
MSDPAEPTADTTILVRCVCGWETRGDLEAVVTATQEHGTRVHNMTATRDQVLAMAIEPSVSDD